MRILPMAAAIACLFLLGRLAGRSEKDRATIIVIGMLVIVMAIARGYYWNVFGRGEGPFTANRITALIVFLGAVTAYPVWQRFRRPRA